ncbi:UNVERIFIED_CONTAM: hypothetical protein Sangu_0284700 [Sesamum angustifolium]|uniref:Uncharacterized protein n=1 Tax=Sesamum angustifolium TaxID=2727405 RepID=A0AAW2QP06_9LAMI
MISVLVQERLSALGSILTGVVISEQRKSIYKSISDTQSQPREPIFGRSSRLQIANMWNKSVDKTFGPIIESLSSRGWWKMDMVDRAYMANTKPIEIPAMPPAPSPLPPAGALLRTVDCKVAARGKNEQSDEMHWLFLLCCCVLGLKNVYACGGALLGFHSPVHELDLQPW